MAELQTLGGRYQVVSPLAEGGMGAIYLGKRLGPDGFEKEVVLKQLLPEFTRQPEFIDLFLREARLTADLDHANIVRTLDLVRSGDTTFMVMEYVRGADLRTLLKRAKRRKRRLSPAAALFIAREVLGALAYAHERKGVGGKPLGLIHRDVSPSNILISAGGDVKLTDFGIAKATTHKSVLHRVKGKLGYMSPEQANNEPLLPRSDLYSAAVCLYEMLTGERLLVAATVATTTEAMYSQPVPALSEKVPGLPRELDPIMRRALRVDPERRYQSAAQLADILHAIAVRASLLCSPRDLARHLEEICGPAAEWGSASIDSVREVTSTNPEVTGEGTEKIVLGSLGEELEDEDIVWLDKSGPVQRVRAEPEPDSRRFSMLELTSIIEAKAPAPPMGIDTAPAPRLTRRGWPWLLLLLVAAALLVVAVLVQLR